MLSPTEATSATATSKSEATSNSITYQSLQKSEATRLQKRKAKIDSAATKSDGNATTNRISYPPMHDN